MRGQEPLGFDADPFEQAFGQLAGPVHWPSLSEGERQQAMAELRDWVRGLVDRFAVEVRVVPPCWERHNGIVEALSALRDHERASFSEHGSPTGAVDWFRALREIEARLTDLASRTQCSVQEHRQDAVRDWLLGDTLSAHDGDAPGEDEPRVRVGGFGPFVCLLARLSAGWRLTRCRWPVSGTAQCCVAR